MLCTLTKYVTPIVEFVMPKSEARRLLGAYNTVYELNMSDETIESALMRSTKSENVVIDDLLKILSRTNQ